MRSIRDGADYVIVPAMSRDDDPAALQWIKSQAAKGAIIVGVCAGAKVVGNTGLLDGKRATTHWYSLKELRDEHPAIRLCRRPAAGGRPRRCDDDGDHRVDADVAHPDRSHRRPGQGRGGRPGSRPYRLGRASRQRRVPVHAPVRADGDPQRPGLLEQASSSASSLRPAWTKCRWRSSRTPGRAPIAPAP